MTLYLSLFPVTVLKTVAGINHAVDAGDPTATVHLMLLPEACLTDIEEDETVWQRYQDKLASRKRKNASVSDFVF